MAGGPCRPRPASKIIAPNRGSLVFRNELRKRVRTSHVGGSFSVWGIEEGIEVLAKPIFVRAQPFNGSGTAAPFNGWHAPCLGGAPCSLFIQNHCAKSGSLGFFNELRKRVRTSHVGGSFSVWGIEEGIEVLAKPIFVRAQPFNGSGTAVPFNGWHAPCLAGMSHARTLRLIVRGG